MIFMGIDTSGDHDVTTPYVLSLVISNDSKSIEESNLIKCYKSAIDINLRDDVLSSNYIIRFD